jgi:P27 family predicted phage terminase small subunit
MNLKSPKPQNKLFTKYWTSLIESVKDKPNLNVSHLYQVEVLCDLYVEYDNLCKSIELDGYIITNISKAGETTKLNPYVTQKNTTVKLIKEYSTALGLELAREKMKEESNEEEKDDWS